jgi:hypothetical protein
MAGVSKAVRAWVGLVLTLLVAIAASLGVAVTPVAAQESVGINCDEFEVEVNQRILTVPDKVAITPYIPVEAFGDIGATLECALGFPSYSIEGTLPPGLSLDSRTGQISGTPNANPSGASQVFQFELRAHNNSAAVRLLGFQYIKTSISIVVKRNIELRQNDAAIRHNFVVTPNQMTVRAGQPISKKPYFDSFGFGTVRRWSVTPALPAGLVLDPATGTITGAALPSTANLTGTTHTIQVEDRVQGLAGLTQLVTADTKTLRIVVEPALETAAGTVPVSIVTGVPVEPFRPVTATGGIGAITFSLDGRLPAGLSFNRDTGEISGTPTERGYNTRFTVEATDASGYKARRDFTVPMLGIDAFQRATSLSIESGLPLGAQQNWTQPVTYSAFTSPLSVTITPNLPAGLSMDPATGTITGTVRQRIPRTEFTMTARDSSNPNSVVENRFTLQVDPLPPIGYTISPAGGSAAGGTQVVITGVQLGGQFGDTEISIAGYKMRDVLYSQDGQRAEFTLPAMPLVRGTYPVEISSPGSSEVSRQLTFTVAPALATTSPPGGIVRFIGPGPFSATPVVGQGGAGTLTYAASGLLPDGFSFNTATGEISGTPTGPGGQSGITISVTDQDSPPATAMQQIILEVSPPVQTTLTAPSFTFQAGQPVAAFPVAASGGTEPYVFTATGLPAGLSINRDTGQITGTPSLALNAPQTVTVTVTPTPGYAGATSAKSFPVTITGLQVALSDTRTLTWFQGDQLRFGGTAQASFTPFRASGGTGAITYAITPPLPPGLTLDPATGAISGTATRAAPLTQHTITATDSAPVPNTLSGRTTTEVRGRAPTITAVSPVGIFGNGSQTVTVTGARFGPTFANATTVTLGGVAVQTLVIAPDGNSLTFLAPALPPGDAELVITNDNLTPARRVMGITAFPTLTLQVVQPTVSFTRAVTGFAQPVVVQSGGRNGRTFAIAPVAGGPALPAGLTFNTSNGTLSGAATDLLASADFSVTVTDGGQPVQSVSQTFTLSVVAPPAVIPPPTIASATPRFAAANGGTRITVTGTGFRSDTIFGFGNFSADRRATEVAVSADGTSATMVVPPRGTFTFEPTLVANTPSAGSATARFSYFYEEPIRAVAAVPEINVVEGEPMQGRFPLSITGNGIGARTYSVSPALPPGLTLSATTGFLSGTPTGPATAATPATVNHVFTVTDSNTTPESSSVTIPVTVGRRVQATVVNATVALDPGRLMTPLVPVQREYGIDLTIGEAIGTDTYAISPALPAGLSFDPQTGRLSGTPTVGFGPTRMDVTITDSGAKGVVGSTVTASFTLEVRPSLAATRETHVTAAANQPLSIRPVSARGGIAPLRYGVSPPLPFGLTLNTVSGNISGTPTEPLATSAFTMTVTDSAPAPATTSASFDLTVTVPPPSISGLSRTAAPNLGGDELIILGSGFVRYAGLTGPLLVEFVGSGGAVAATSATLINDGQIRVVTPAATAGDYWVRVTMPHGASSRSAASAFRIETLPPTGVTLSAASTSTSGPFLLTIEFAEAVTGFEETDLILFGPAAAGGTITDLRGSGRTYRATVTPGTNGLLTVDLPPMQVTGVVSGQGNAASNTLQMAVRTSPVTVTIDFIANNTIITSLGVTKDPLQVRFQFSEPVLDFTASDVTLNAGTTLANLRYSGSSELVADLDRASDGETIVTLAPGLVTDVNGIVLDTSGTGRFRIDRTAPTYTISVPPLTAFSNGPVSAVITFSEPLKRGLGNTFNPGYSEQFWRHMDSAGAAGFSTQSTQLSDRSWQITWTPTSQGVARAKIQPWISFFDGTPASGTYDLRDMAGNVVVAQTFPTVTLTDPYVLPGGFIPTVQSYTDPVWMVDAQRPYTYLSQEGGTAPVNGPFDVRVRFAGDDSFSNIYGPPGPDAVTGFTLSDVVVTNGRRSDLICRDPAPATSQFGPAEWNCLITIVPTGTGSVTVSIPENIAVDRGGNGNRASAVLTVAVAATVDPAPLTLTATSPVTSSNQSQTITFAFNKDVTGFEETDLVLGDGTILTSFTAVNARTYSAEITRTTDGTALVTAPAGAATDAVGLTNPQAQASFTMDVTRPALAIELPGGGQLPAGAFDATFRFSEGVTGFALGDINLDNAAASNLRGAAGDSSYLVTLTPAAAGDVRIGVPAGAALDVAGNGSVAAAGRAFSRDATAPVAQFALQTPAATVTGAFTLTITFSKPVVDFVLADLQVSNGAASNLDCTATDANLPRATSSCTVLITPASLGQVGVTLAAGAVQDRPGNPNPQAAFQIENVPPAPVPTLTGPLSVQTGAFQVAATFTTGVTGLEASDFQITNGTAGALTGTGTSWFLTVTPRADGPVLVDLPTDVAVGGNGLGNLAAQRLTVQADITAPVPTLTGPTTVQRAAFQLTVAFSEPVTGFDLSDLQVTNGTPSGLTGSGTNWQVQVAPGTDGEVRVALAAGAASDAAGNATTTTSFAVQADLTAPTLSIGGPTGTQFAPFTATITFAEPVTGFDSTDLAVTNATLSAFAGSDASYSVLVTPVGTASFTITLDIAAGAAADTAGNLSTGAQTASFAADLSRPVPTLTGPATVQSGAFAVTVTVTVPVTGLEASDFVIGNGTAGSLTGSGVAYSLQVTPLADGPVTVDLPADAATAASGAGTVAAQRLTLQADITRPGLQLAGPTSEQRTAFPVVATFAEPVTGLDLADFQVTRAMVSALTGSGTTWQVLVTPTADGQVEVSLADGAAADGAGNPSVAARFAVAADVTAPTVAISGPAGTQFSAFTATVTFSEPVIGFELTDLVVANASLSGLSGSGAAYTVLVTPISTAPTTVTLDIPAAAAGDAAGNPSAAAQQASFAADLARARPTLTGPTAVQTGPFSLTVTFTAPVTGLDSTDFVVTNGTAGALTGSGAAYTLAVTPSADGEVRVVLPADAAATTSGAGNLASSPFVVQADVSRPTVQFSGPTTVQRSAFTLGLTFSEPVTSLELSDLAVTRATASGLTGAGTSYQVTITPSSEGQVSVALADGAAADANGNGSVAGSYQVQSDTIAPTVTISGPSGTQVAAFTATITFSEPVTGFDVADLQVAQASLSGFAGSGAVYTVLVTPTDAAPVTVTLDIAAGAASDPAGNPSLAAQTASFAADLARATATLSGPTTVQTAAFDVGVVFSYPVTGLEPSDFSITNGTAGALTGSGASYTLRVTPVADGAVTIALPAGAATRSNGTGTLAATPLVVRADVTRPTVSLTGPTTIQRTTFTLTLTFSEPVTGLELSDLAVTRATAAGLTGSGAIYQVQITPTSEGLVSVALADGAASDAAGNGSVAGSYQVQSDTIAPTVTISGPSGTQVAAFTATVTFSEPVTGFDLTDLRVTNAALSGFAGSGAVYTVLVTPTDAAPVTVTLDVAAGAASDVAGNPSLAAAQASFAADLARATATLSGPATVQTGAFDVGIAFSYPVTGLEPSDFQLTNGTAGALTGSGASYSLRVTPVADGAVTIALPAGAATRSNGTGTLAATPLVVQADVTRPTVTLAGPTAIQRSTFTVTLTFSEPVTGLEVSDLVVTRASAAGLTGSGAVYQVQITPSSEGLVSVSLGEGAASDAAGNGSVAGSYQVQSDTIAPTVAISGPTTLQRAAFPVTVTFSEPVTGFDLSDVVVSNASLSGLTGSGASYALLVTPIDTAPASIRLEVPAGAAVDAAGNPSRAAQPVVVAADLTRPLFQTATPGFSVSMAVDSSETDLTRIRGVLDLRNAGTADGLFSASVNVNWLDIAPASGRLVRGQSVQLVITPNARVNALAAGTYRATATVVIQRDPGPALTGSAAPDISGLGLASAASLPGAAAAAAAAAGDTTVQELTVPVTIAVAPRRGTVTIVALASPAVLAGDATFTYASAAPGLGGVALTTTGGRAQSATVTLDVGRYDLSQSLPDGWQLSAINCAGDTDGGSTYTLSSRSAVVDLDGSEALVCTFTNTREAGFVQAATRRGIVAFMAERARLLESAAPDLMARADDIQIGTSPSSGTFNAEGSDHALTASLRWQRTFARGGTATLSDDGLTDTTGQAGLSIWLQSNYARGTLEERGTNLTSRSQVWITYLGADLPVTDWLRAGVVGQWDQMEFDGRRGTPDAGGDGWMLSPYLAGRLAGEIRFITRIGWGRSSNWVDPLGTYRDSFDTERMVGEARLSNSVTLWQQESSKLTLRPEVSVWYYRDEQQAYVNRIGIPIAATMVDVGNLAFSPQLVWTTQQAGGSRMQVDVKLTGASAFNQLELADQAGRLTTPLGTFQARADVGFSILWPSGWQLEARADYSGLGSSTATSGGVSVRLSTGF